jgi:LysM repeat protein
MILRETRAILLALFTMLVCTAWIQAQPVASQVQSINGRKFNSYRVQPKDTWTNLSARYAISATELQQANPGITELKVGQTLFVPAETGSAVRQTGVQHQTQGEYIYHTVAKGETLYRISKMYNQQIPDIKKWNNLTSDNVPLGGKLIVGVPGKSAVKEKEPSVPVTTEIRREKPPEKKPAPAVTVPDTGSFSSGTVEKVTEVGVATWLNNDDLNQNKFYALHRTAPIGTIIKVTNRMNNNAVFVKVVGVLPDTGENDNIIIKITQAAAQRIGAIDQRFTAELNYGISH